MAYNMVFLLIPDGTKTYEDGGAGGTLTSGGTDDYTTGYWAGVQAYHFNNAFDALYGSGILPATISNSGWCAVRFQTQVTGAAFVVPWRIGSVSTDDYLALSAAQADSHVIKLGYLKDGGSTASVFTVGTIANTAGTEYFFYADWDGTTIRVRKQNAAIVSGTRATPDGNVAASTPGQLRIGSYDSGQGGLSASNSNGWLSGIAFGTGNLTDDEIDRLYNATEPWTWNMPSDPPVVDAGSNGTTTTNVEFTRSGSFTDADSAGPWTATVDYDDGGGEEPLTLDGFDFDLAHTWDTAGTYTVVVAVTDEGSIEGTDAFDVTVENSDDPIVDIGVNGSADQGIAWTRSGSFTDADSAGPWTATVNYGDGGGDQPLTLDGFDFDLVYSWDGLGTYPVTVEIDDGHGGIGISSINITVTEAPTVGSYIPSGITGSDASAPIVTLY